MSPELKAFYVSYAKWLNEGAPQDQPYSRGFGLCTNAIDLSRQAEHEMENQFLEAGLHPLFPFGGRGVYFTASRRDEHHLNPERRAWVFEKANMKDNDNAD